MRRLSSFSYSNDVLSWILDFLSNRKKRVVLSGYFSKDEAVTSGVLQGSVLGLALFLFHISDIGLC